MGFFDWLTGANKTQENTQNLGPILQHCPKNPGVYCNLHDRSPFDPGHDNPLCAHPDCYYGVFGSSDGVNRHYHSGRRHTVSPSHSYCEQHSFFEGKAHTLSHVILKADDMHKESYKVGGQDICTILKDNKAPKFINFMGIDIEGSFGDSFSIEEHMLKELLAQDEYKIGFFAIEHYWPPTVDSIFDSYDYVRIYNPYLKGIWLDQETGLAYTLSPWGHFICQQTGEEKTINVNHLKRIEWECYYVHLDVLKENKVLKRFLTP